MPTEAAGWTYLMQYRQQRRLSARSGGRVLPTGQHPDQVATVRKQVDTLALLTVFEEKVAGFLSKGSGV